MKREESSNANFDEATSIINEINEQINRHILGQGSLLKEALCSFLVGGHHLITGAPGLAKTTLVKLLSRILGLDFKRIQFTPDLLPSDILGSEILNIDPETSQRHFVFSKGPIFANFILADEINRASPRTQSALLEAMQEHTVTISGKHYSVPEPFMVFATQNPLESEGTFPLPEAQMDRFLLHSLISYPNEKAEVDILRAHANDHLIGEGKNIDGFEIKALGKDQINRLIKHAKTVHVPEEIIYAIYDLVSSTRPQDSKSPELTKSGLWYGSGPRGGLSLVSACKAYALLDGCNIVAWKHVKLLAKPALRHRLRLTSSASRDGVDADNLIESLLEIIEKKHKNLACAKDA